METTRNFTKNWNICWFKVCFKLIINQIVFLRHSLHLTELLSKDFYWDRPELEKLYNHLCRYFAINHRLA